MTISILNLPYINPEKAPQTLYSHLQLLLGPLIFATPIYHVTITICHMLYIKYSMWAPYF